MRLADEVGDLQKKRVLIEKYNGLFQSEKLSDLKWQIVDIEQRRVENQRRTLEGTEHRKHVGLATKNNEHRRLRGNLRDLTEKLRGTYPELSKLDMLVREKQNALSAARKRHEDKKRGQNEYMHIGEANAAAGKALKDKRIDSFIRQGFLPAIHFPRVMPLNIKTFKRPLDTIALWIGTIEPRRKSAVRSLQR